MSKSALLLAMNEFVANSRHSNLPKVFVKEFTEEVFKNMKETIITEGRFTCSNFGTFTVR